MKSLSRPPLLLYSYLATEMLAPFFASFLIMNCVFFLVKLIPFLNFVLELNIGLTDFIRLFSYLFPNMFLYSIPMAAMIGITIGFSRLANDSEILALKASGISIYKILPPVITVATLIALLTSYFSIVLIPVSEVAMKQLTYQLIKEKIDKGIQEHQFTEALGDLVVFVGKIEKETGEWQDVWVSDMRGQVIPTITMASTGKMKSDTDKMKVIIILRNGSLHRSDTPNSQIVQFEKYELNIPLQLPASSATTFDRGTLTMPELLEKGEEFGGISTEKGRVLIIEFHKRLVLPVGCLILCLLGLPLGLQAGPRRKAMGIPFALAIFIIYYVLFTFAKMAAKENSVPIPLAMWSPNILLLLLALFCIRQVANEQPLVPEVLQNALFEFLKKFFVPIFSRMQKTFFAVLDRLRPRNIPQILPESPDSPIQQPLRGDAKKRIFHFSACEDYSCKQCSLEFKNLEVAIEAGFLPCDFCKSLIEEFRHPPSVS
ncbi:MAG: LPS export ABC transporter permease LptF [Desulfoprunum sp.]|nr:LPS export ABC transporter permease LptF [Desulfoprunum sp.]